MPAKPARASVGASDDAARSQPYFRRVVFLAALYGLGPWATIGFPLLSATIMLQKGFRVGDSLLFAGLSMLGPTIGITILAFLFDRIERWFALILCAATLVVLGLAFDLGSTLTLLVLLGFGFNLASAAYSTLLSIYGAELFPTDRRALATSARLERRPHRLGVRADRLAAAACDTRADRDVRRHHRGAPRQHFVDRGCGAAGACEEACRIG